MGINSKEACSRNTIYCGYLLLGSLELFRSELWGGCSKYLLNTTSDIQVNVRF